MRVTTLIHVKRSRHRIGTLALALCLVLAAGVAASEPASAGKTRMVKDIWPGSPSSEPKQLVGAGGLLFFRARAPAIGHELFVSDGTPAGTGLVKDIRAGYSSNPWSLTNVGGALYFTAGEGGADDSTCGAWTSDGTAAGTHRVAHFEDNSCSTVAFAGLDGWAIFTGSRDEPAGRGLWKTQGSAASTERISDVPARGPIASVKGQVFFLADDGVHGYELWRSDGTPAGTRMVRDINPGPESSDARQFGAVGGTLFFSATDGLRGHELWKSDGTRAGTRLVKNIGRGGGDAWPSNPQHLTAFRGALYFTADDGRRGRELWKSDGTARGTVLVRDLWRGRSGSDPRALTVARGRLFFIASPRRGRANYLWQTRGTPGTTRPVFARGGVRVKARLLERVGRSLFFATYNRGLWRTNGTPRSTRLVRKNSPTYFNFQLQLTNVQGTLFLTAVSDAHGREVWRHEP